MRFVFVVVVVIRELWTTKKVSNNLISFCFYWCWDFFLICISVFWNIKWHLLYKTRILLWICPPSLVIGLTVSIKWRLYYFYLNPRSAPSVMSAWPIVDTPYILCMAWCWSISSSLYFSIVFLEFVWWLVLVDYYICGAVTYYMSFVFSSNEGIDFIDWW